MAEAQSTASNGKRRSAKPKYTHLSLDDKCAIIRRLEAGETNTQLAQEYGVVHSAISYIKKSKENINAQRALLEDQQGSGQRTRITLTDTSPLEQSVYRWYCQKRALGEPISGPLIRKKALLYNEKLGGPSTFQASNGWIQRFKTRHRIHEISRRGEKVSGDVGASCTFATEFSKIIAEGGYKLDNIYNADETGLAWKSLPRRKSDAQNGNEGAVERVTLLACANASGTHRIPLLVIGKSQNPKCLRNAKVLPVNYCGERNACIDRQIFSDWYRTIFLPAIKARNGRRCEKFLLLLDNTPSHPSAEDLNCIDELCRVIILPPNVSALIQPMDQGVIEKTKKNYKKSLVRQLLLEEEEDIEEDDAAANFLKRWNMLDCCELIAQAWDDLSDATLSNAWRKIFFPNNIKAEIAVVKDSELTHLINRIPQYENFTDEETAVWLQEDSLKNMPVWHIMDDDEILNFDEPAQTLIRSRLQSSQEHDDDQRSTEDAPASREVLKSMSTVLRWYRTRRVVDAEHLSTLTKIRQLIEDSILEP